MAEPEFHAPLSPAAWNKFCPCAANSWKYGLSVPGSAGVHVHEELNCPFNGLAVAIALKMAASLDPTYITRLDIPGPMPSACVMSRVCSVSSQPCDARQLVLVPSVDKRLTGTLLVWCTFA